MAQDLSRKITLCFIKVRVILFLHKYWLSKKSSRLSTYLYNQIYFDCWDQFNPPMGANDTWSDNSDQTN